MTEKRPSTPTYDSNSNMVFITNALGKTVFYKYDGLNRRILETKPSDISTSGLDKDNIDYDGFTAFKTVTYDAVSNVKQIKKADSSKIAYVYDNMERTTQVKHNTVIRQEFAYDALSLARMTEYNGLGGIKQMTLGNGISLAFNYDAHNRETSRSCSLNGSSVYTHGIQARDNQANITFEQIATPAGTVQKSHAYDALDRLLTSTATNKPDIYWAYDLEGNWIETNQNGLDEARLVNRDNQYTAITGQSPTYDANGNMKTITQAAKTLEYDWADRLVRYKVSGVLKQEYFYDARNRRVKINYISGYMVKKLNPVI